MTQVSDGEDAVSLSSLPLLFVADLVVLPGMVVPLELDECDLFAGLPAGPWDVVVSNPPYVRADEIDSLEPEVRDWEPRAALVAEGATEAIARGALDVLREGGALVLEVAHGDAERVASLLRERGYVGVRTMRDLAGRERVVEGARP